MGTEHHAEAWTGPSLFGYRVIKLLLGAARPFLLRPKGGGRSRAFPAGWGDLLVMGGRCQQEFDHSVPKQARAGPRLSLMFRPHDDRANSVKI